MKDIELNLDHSLLDQDQLQDYFKKFEPELNKLKEARRLGYADDRASINAPFDTQGLNLSFELAKKYSQTDTLIVVGIGGSNLGTLAVQEAILGKLHNYVTGPRVFYADTTDAVYLERLVEIIESDLRANKKVLIVGISKSGGTTETIANFELLVEHSLRHGANLAESVVVISDEGSKFSDFADRQGFPRLGIPKKIGGRYSVFSAVGVFPLLILGVDVGQLISGARRAVERCLDNDFETNIAAHSAAVIYHSYQGGLNIHDTFLFGNDLEGLGRWYRQLTGESIGKNDEVGITPTTSIGSTDLHSVAQLYLGGPKDKLTTFVTVDSTSDLSLPSNQDYEQLVSKIQGKKINSILAAIQSGTMLAYSQAQLPFMELRLSDLSAASIGQLLQFKMIEIMLLGCLFEVDPFDQPAVEQYKVETRRILDEA
ncbi:hypothetical protein KC644_03320 [Candidatus Berkelbacteria bacterium]|nr:hypothetical protein [Candidatus Berkelbacteria bacterium]